MCLHTISLEQQRAVVLQRDSQHRATTCCRRWQNSMAPADAAAPTRRWLPAIGKLLLGTATTALAADPSTPDSFCGGDCNTGVNTEPRHGCNYAYMGDEGSVEACAAKCTELHCPCYDYSDPTDKGQVRAGEHCRVCGPTQTFKPFHSSKQHYAAFIPGGGSWGDPVLVVALLLGLYLGGGTIYKTRTTGQRGIHAAPHAAFFIGMRGLVQDGVALVRGRGGGSSSTLRAPLGGPSEGSRGKAVRKESSSRRGDGKKEKGSKEKREGKRQDRTESSSPGHGASAPECGSQRRQQEARPLGARPQQVTEGGGYMCPDDCHTLYSCFVCCV